MNNKKTKKAHIALKASPLRKRGSFLFTVHFQLFILVALAFALRLLVWQWREPYPLGGDETEYLNQAITLLRDRQYVELRLMRPPLYTVFLAVSIYLFDSAVQNLRLVQAVISAFTVLPVYALTWRLFRSRRVAFVAGLLFALNYTLAATATELLTETVFVFGLSVALWLLVKTVDGGRGTVEGSNSIVHRPPSTVLFAGLVLGMLALVRSVALPLVGLGAVWLLVASSEFKVQSSELKPRVIRSLGLPLLFVASALIVILPWTARNYVVYGAPILIDTTGAENLWLDNNASAATPDDPLGREAAKAELYALGEDRAARQTLASRRGLEEITNNPEWFAAKAWGETKKFFALQYFDELREKRAIWVPPAEVWAKLLLGDGLWLVLLFGGIVGFCLDGGQWTVDGSKRRAVHRLPSIVQVRWLFIPWALYIFATSLLFHVELRYRLPVYPVLAPFAAFALVRPFAARRQENKKTKSTVPRFLALLSSCLLVLLLTLLHRFYPAEAWMLANKHAALWRAEQALNAGNAALAQQAAQAALAWDDTSALSRVALARAALLQRDRAAADAAIQDAINALEAHPQAHLLRGALLRRDGMDEKARAELAYETASLQDLQAWTWRAFVSVGPPPSDLAIGSGLDLGYIHGFYPAENGYRWTRNEARVQLAIAANTNAVELEVAPGRPANAAPVRFRVFNGATELVNTELRDGWQTIRVPLATSQPTVELTIRADTFRPRTFDRTSTDNRELGVMLRRAATVVAR